MPGPLLGSSAEPLCSAYDLAMLDLDGVVYIGGHAVPGAPDHLARARDEGMRCAFVTNNASRSPEAVRERLQEMGVPAETGDIVTAAQAAARVLVDKLGAGARVAALGASGLIEALRAEGLQPVGIDEEDAAALVTGYGADVVWRDVMRAAVRVRDGLWWVASNTDYTIPTVFGVAPGHGAMVEMLRRFTAVDPVVAGKPQRPLLDETIRRVGGQRPLMVGDRLDTDIEGATNAEVDSLLVLTGVTGLPELVAAPPEHRPTYLSPDLAGLFTAHAAPRLEDGSVIAAGWRAHVESGRLVMAGAGETADWWRAAAVASWHHLDESGAPPGIEGLRPPVDGQAPGSEHEAE